MVLGDYGSDEGIGIIAVNEHPTKSDLHDDTEKHWITMPDGKLRTWYNHRDISASDFDMLKSFNSLPELKISYRPISKYLSKKADFFSNGIALSILALAFSGFILLVFLLAGGDVNQFASLSMKYIGIAILSSFTFFFIGCFAQSICHKRYYRKTYYDYEPLRWHEERKAYDDD